ncbi:hypothetical protein CEE86_13925 [Lactobacillus crispatus]|nr:hypothetical protein CEE86_13925 [Lactobacillus crispatus]
MRVQARLLAHRLCGATSSLNSLPPAQNTAQVPSPVRERDRVRGATYPEKPDPSPQPSPRKSGARENAQRAMRGHPNPLRSR